MADGGCKSEMTVMTMNSTSTLGTLADLARAQVETGSLTQPSEEWRYTDLSIWGDRSASSEFPIQWTATESVTVKRASETADNFGEQFGWAVTELTDNPGAVTTLALANDALVITGHGRVYLAVAATVPTHIPVVVRVAEGQRMEVSLVSTGSVTGHTCISVHLAPNAECVINEVKTHSAPLVSSTYLVIQESKSHFQWVGVDGLTGVGIRTIRVRQTGDEAKTFLTALNLGAKKSQNYIHTHVEHLLPGGESRQLVKSVLTDQSVSEFKGLVYVAPGAQKTDSSQSNQNMILSEQARALSRPQLSIFADDVKCAHGATMSQLDADQIYYLQTRGVNPAEAKAVLMTGFADEVAGQFTMDSVIAIARETVRHFFESIS